MEPIGLEQWRKGRQEGQDSYVLPSGLLVRLNKVNLIDLAAQGNIPVPLMGQASKVLGEGFGQGDLEKIQANIEIINIVVRAAVVDPPIADEPGPGVIGIDELTASEKLLIYGRVNRMGSLIPFRPEPDSPQSD